MATLFIGSLRNVLINQRVKPEHFTLMLNEATDIVTAKVTKPNGQTRMAVEYVDDILNKPNHFVAQLVDLALWYHGGQMPQSRSFAEWLSDCFAKLFGITK